VETSRVEPQAHAEIPKKTKYYLRTSTEAHSSSGFYGLETVGITDYCCLKADLLGLRAALPVDLVRRGDVTDRLYKSKNPESNRGGDFQVTSLRHMAT
jgi:hypothetical protein